MSKANSDDGELGCLGLVLLAIVSVAVLGLLIGFLKWVDTAPQRECIAQHGTWSMHDECTFTSAEPAECKPTAAACEKALADRCQADADGGVWEAVPFCHCLTCNTTDPEIGEELDSAVEKWKREGPKL